MSASEFFECLIGLGVLIGSTIKVVALAVIPVVAAKLADRIFDRSEELDDEEEPP